MRMLQTDYNRRRSNGPKEGRPGQTLVVLVNEIRPPLVLSAVVEDDGYFSDSFYDDVEQRVAAYRQAEK